MIGKNRSAIPRGSDRKTSGGGKFPLEKLSAQRKRKRTEDRIGWAMSGVKHDPSLFGKLTPRTKAKADVYRSRFFQRARTETASSTDGPIEPGCVLNPGWPRLVRINRTRCGKLYQGFPSPQTNGMRVGQICMGRD